MTDTDDLLQNLICARKEVAALPHWVSWTPRENRAVPSVYSFASRGWEANDYQGAYWEIISWLRTFIPGGDLTDWWQGRRGRDEVAALFDAAITYLKMERGEVA